MFIALAVFFSISVGFSVHLFYRLKNYKKSVIRKCETKIEGLKIQISHLQKLLPETKNPAEIKQSLAFWEGQQRALENLWYELK